MTRSENRKRRERKGRGGNRIGKIINRIKINQLIQPVLFIFLVSCAGLGNDLVKSPQISVTQVSIDNLQLNKQDIRVSLNIYNPNPVPIPVRGLTYHLDLNDIEFANGFNQTRIDIPASGEEEVDITISGDLISFLLKHRMVQRDSLSYSLTGDVAILSSSIRFPYSRRGHINVPDYINNFIER